MRTASFLTFTLLGLSSLLGGCLTASGDIDSPDDESIVEEKLGEAQGALVGCTGESCNGQDAGLMGCDADATTVSSSPIFSPSLAIVGTIAIRRSNACNAVWARASTSSGTAYLRAEIVRVGPPFSGAAAPNALLSGLRSPMVGKITGSTYNATGLSGSSFGSYPNMGQVSKTF